MNRMLFVVLCLLFSACSEKAPSLSEPEPIGQGIWVDVRTPQEFAAGHVPGALNLPHDQIRADHPVIASTSKEETLLVYCRSGRRSAIAKDRLESLGFSVLDIGGFNNAKALSAED